MLTIASSDSASTWSNTSSSSTESLTANTSIGASLSSVLGEVAPSTTITSSVIVPSTETPAASAVPTVCATADKVGNATYTFSNTAVGPLFNPIEDIWFSEGFCVVPPTDGGSPPYLPCSGSKLLEFVPPSLQSSDPWAASTAEIGVGPNFAKPCFRFDLYEAYLGCDTQGTTEWCEFEVAAYTHDESSPYEQSMEWAETKRIPACNTFIQGGCPLVPVQFEGFTNMTSVLITLHVGLEPRVWWADHISVGWTDNGCDAAQCRDETQTKRVKRQRVESALEHGVWHWTRGGLERLADDYILRAAK
ncbi:hypothetical protein B0I35DRAFT_346099 [Stachybotrys elegans]|uniref:DUF7371 domain-containing protein n=1 Tax=Stachybotrys elegans TaxID=80388 RepID=A0A8K0T0U5_9HYPO|nr:hypothetical protein B0I35DRAFT_346099 [Stachybotrys elegans]